MHLVNDSQNIAFKHIRHAYVIIHADNELYKSPWIQSNGMHHVPQMLTHTHIYIHISMPLFSSSFSNYITSTCMQAYIHVLYKQLSTAQPNKKTT